MYLSDRYPDFAGTLPNRDPDAAQQPGGDRHHRRRSQAREVPQLQRHRSPAAAVATSRRRWRTSARSGCRPDLTRSTARSTASRTRRSTQYGDLLFSSLSSQPQLGIPVPYPGFTGTVQQALQCLSAVHRRHAILNDFRGKTRYNSLQATIERRFTTGLRASRRRTPGRRPRTPCCKQDGSGDEWALASNRHFRIS